MTAAKTVKVFTDPGHVFVPAVDGVHMDPIDEYGVEVKASILDKIVASAVENGVRLQAEVADDEVAPVTPTIPAGAPEKQEG